MLPQHPKPTAKPTKHNTIDILKSTACRGLLLIELFLLVYLLAYLHLQVLKSSPLNFIWISFQHIFIFNDRFQVDNVDVLAVFAKLYISFELPPVLNVFINVVVVFVTFYFLFRKLFFDLFYDCIVSFLFVNVFFVYFVLFSHFVENSHRGAIEDWYHTRSASIVILLIIALQRSSVWIWSCSLMKLTEIIVGCSR